MKRIFLICFIINVLPSILYIKDDYDYLYEWGKNNSVYITHKIAMNYTNENIKNYYVNEKIEKGETIMSIPKDVLLDINSALNLSNSKIKKEYKNYKKEKLDGNNNIYEVKEDRIEHSFLAYLMTIGIKHKSKKNKFYQFYQYFFNTFETEVDKYPTFYTSEQINLILFSLLGKGILQTKTMIEEEYDFLKKVHKKEFDFDEYMKYRLVLFSKIVRVSDMNYIVPFVDILEKGQNHNLQIKYKTDTKTITVVANKDIEPNDKLILEKAKMSNLHSLLIYAKVYEENKDYFNIFRVPIICKNFVIKKKLDQMLSKEGIVDLTEKDYYKQVLPAYMKLTKVFNKEETEASALSIFIENLHIIKGVYDNFKISTLYENFYKSIYAENINRVLDSEKNYLDKKIKELEKIINELSAKEKTNVEL